MLILKQSTASQAVLLGPFVDDTDGATAEDGLTIANTDIRLSKNGGNMAAKNSGGGTIDENGWYTITLDATDTNTVGRLQVSCKVSGALAVFMEFQIVEEDTYEYLYASGSAPDTQVAAIKSDTAAILTDTGTTLDTIVDAVLVDTGTTIPALIATAQADLDIITGASGVNLLTATQASIDAIEADTNELQTDWADGGRLDTILDAAGSAGDPWSTALPGAYGAGTAGKIVGDNINAPLATIDTVVDGIQADLSNGTDGLGAIKAETAAILTDTGTTLDAVVDAVLVDTGTTIPALIATAQADLDIITGASGVNLLTATQASIDAIEADTNELQSDDVPGLIATLDAVVDTVKVDTAAIKVKTDDMVFTKANELDVNTQSINGATVVGDGNGTPWDGA